jgi:aldose 1-epimerase
MQYIDDAEFQIAIDLDNGARISSITWRDLQFTIPYRGTPMHSGWYAMGPWAGRIRDGIIRGADGEEIQLPTNFTPPHAMHGLGFTASWQEIGPGRSLLHLPKPYGGATMEQTIEVLDDAIRWSLEYDTGDCKLPAWIGMHPWFARDLDRGGSAEIEFKAAKMLKRDDEGIPTGEIIAPTNGTWDDAFTEIQGVPAIVWEDAARIDIESDAPWWVVFNEDSEGICIEPQTAPPDAQNLGISGEHYLEALFVFSES